MEFVIALSIIFSVVALFTAIYTGEELMKLRDSTKGILDLVQKIIDNDGEIIKYIDALEDRTKKED